jgi:putative hydrolase of the HAD superfamily
MLVTTLLLDIGGVLLTNGWDHLARKRAAKNFELKWAGMEERHRLTFETHEEGKLTFEEYLSRVVFYEKRPFTRTQFQRFMCDQSKPYPKMIELVAQLKVRSGLKIAVLSDESRELNAYRIRKFKLDGFVDAFISSCFVHIRKPDPDIYRLALDIAMAPARHVLYIETPRRLSRSRKVWGFEAFFRPITSPQAPDWPRSDCLTKEPPMNPANPSILTVNGGESSAAFSKLTWVNEED